MKHLNTQPAANNQAKTMSVLLVSIASSLMLSTVVVTFVIKWLANS